MAKLFLRQNKPQRYRLCCLTAVSLSVFFSAQTIVSKELLPKDFNHQFNLGLEVQHYHYKEPRLNYIEGDGWEWMEQKAWMGGVNSSYRLTWKDQLFVQPETRILWGKENYKTGDGDKYRAGLKHKVPDLIFEPRLIAGGHINFAERWIVSPYSGIGYRLKIDDGEKGKFEDDHTLAYRKSNYVYVPLGAYVDCKISDIWSVSAKGEYDYFIKGWQYQRNRNDFLHRFKQTSGYGLKGELSVSYAYNDRLSISLTPYIHYWNIKDSNLDRYEWQEPHNITVESGLRLGINF